MTRRPAIRPRVLLVALLLACVSASAVEDRHRHHGTTEIDGETPVPRIALTVVEDSVSGWNVYADVKHFRFAPDNASRAPVSGEGHAHLYVDGVKVARVYGPAYHLGALEPGPHEITYSLHGNDHAAYTFRGQPIADTVRIEASRTGDRHHGGHGHDAAIEVPATGTVPSVKLAVHRDPKSGWNVRAALRGFRFTPEEVGGEPSYRGGHGHLYVDGRKVARLYTDAYHLDNLAPGRHDIKLTLNANDHRPLVHRGREIADTVSVTVAEAGPHAAQVGERHPKAPDESGGRRGSFP